MSLLDYFRTRPAPTIEGDEPEFVLVEAEDISDRWVKERGIQPGQRVEPVVTASMRPWHDRTERPGAFRRSGGVTDADWQTKLRYTYRHGPSLVGDAVDFPADLMRLVSWHVEKRDQYGNWEKSEDPRQSKLLSDFVSSDGGIRKLAAIMSHHLDLVAHFVGVVRQHNGRWVYSVHAPSNVARVGTDVVAVRAWQGATPGDTDGYFEVPIRHVSYFWAPDPEWPGLPFCRLARASDNIEMVRLVDRLAERTYRRRIVLPGVMWSQSTDHLPSWPDDMRSYIAASQQDVEDRRPSSLGYFAFSTEGEPPKLIEATAKIDQMDLDVQARAAENVIRTTGLPIKTLLEGPGTANMWNEAYVNDYVADFVMWPRVARIADIITMWHQRPWTRGFSRSSMRGYDADEWRVGFDLSRIESRTDNTSSVLALFDKGQVNRAAAANIANLSEADLLEIPEGMTEAEWWAITHNVTLPGGEAAQPSEPVEAGEPAEPAESPEPPEVPGEAVEEDEPGGANPPTRFETPGSDPDRTAGGTPVPPVAAEERSEFDRIMEAEFDTDLML